MPAGGRRIVNSVGTLQSTGPTLDNHSPLPWTPCDRGATVMKPVASRLYLAVSLIGMLGSSTKAAIVVNAIEVGGNVVFSGGGTANVADLTLVGGDASSTTFVWP